MTDRRDSEAARRPRASRAAMACAILAAVALLGCRRAPTTSDERGARLGSERPDAALADARADLVTAEAGGATAAGSELGTAVVELLDGGRPPRRKLRYEWRVGRGELLTMDLRTAASTGRGARGGERDVTLPPVRLRIAIDPRSVSDGGDLRYAWRVVSSEVDAPDGGADSLAAGMRAEVLRIAGLSGEASVSDRGLTRSIVVDPAEAGAATSAMAEQVRQTLRDVAAPFPEEEVGFGARWRKRSELDGDPERVRQTETFRVVELGPNDGVLEDDLEQTAPAQPLGTDVSGVEGDARMESMLASGKAWVRFDRSRLVAQTAFDGTTSMVLADPAGGGNDGRHVAMRMHVSVAISGSAR